MSENESTKFFLFIPFLLVIWNDKKLYYLVYSFLFAVKVSSVGTN